MTSPVGTVVALTWVPPLVAVNQPFKVYVVVVVAVEVADVGDTEPPFGLKVTVLVPAVAVVFP